MIFFQNNYKISYFEICSQFTYGSSLTVWEPQVHVIISEVNLYSGFFNIIRLLKTVIHLDFEWNEESIGFTMVFN